MALELVHELLERGLLSDNHWVLRVGGEVLLRLDNKAIDQIGRGINRLKDACELIKGDLTC